MHGLEYVVLAKHDFVALLRGNEENDMMSWTDSSASRNRIRRQYSRYGNEASANLIPSTTDSLDSWPKNDCSRDPVSAFLQSIFQTL